MKSILIRTSLILGLGLIPFSSMATENTTTDDEPAGPKHHRAPPQEAIDACKDKSEGDKVNFIAPRGDTIEATCTMRKNGMVAVPAHSRKDHHPDKNGEKRLSKPE
jgi:hypothetical protein